ncbi:MAG: phosphoesterase [Methanomicrobiales archaeon]|nr:phosphoesterase [Methanomicrobiales archaeon]
MGSDTNGNLMKALSSRNQHVVHLTHNDLDAAGSDAVHRRRFGQEGVFTLFCSVGKFPAMLDAVAGSPGRGDLLSISDLGFQRGSVEKIKKAKSNGWRIEWRDHHRWTGEEIASVKAAGVSLSLDTATCATGIVARELMPGDETAFEVAQVVCDYDLWKHADPRSKVLGQVVMRKEHRDYVRDALVRGVFSDTAIEAAYAAIVAEMEEQIEHSIRHTTVLGTKYRIAFAPLYGYPSETAHTIRERLDTDIEVIVSDNGRFSIRSVPPVSHLIARAYDGGGHPPAAGGTFPFTFFDKVKFFLLKRTRHFDDLVRVAEALESCE